MTNLQNAQNDSKNDKNVNFIIFPENSNPDLYFDIGFDSIRQLQIPKSKMTDFGTFSKIESKIRKINQLQSNVEIALVDGF